MVAKVEGVDRLTKKLHDLPVAYQREIFDVHSKGMERMANMARGLAPIDDGALRASIDWGWGEPGSNDKAPPRSTAPDAKQKVFAWAGDAKAFYARWVEFGTVNRSAQPFFFPAWRTLRKSITSANKRVMSKVAKKVAAGGN